MNAAIVSYVLANVANIADVDRSDVHTSVRGGRIVLNNVVLRRDTMNKILPLPIERGEAAELSVKIPNPTMSDPVRVDLSGAHLVFPLELTFPPTERSMEEVLRDITDTTILGGLVDVPGEVVAAAAASGTEPPSPTTAMDTAWDGTASFKGDLSMVSASTTTEDTDPLAATGWCTESDALSTHSANDEDLRSCRSDTDATESNSASSSDDDEGGDAGGSAAPQGWFAYLRERATRSVEWIWQRPVEVVFTNLTLSLPCDARKNISFEFKVDEFAVTIKPQQPMGAEQLKVVSIAVRNVVVLANSAGVIDAAPQVVSLGEVDITITKVYATRGGALLRSNVAVNFPGAVSVTADEDTLQALVQCQVTRDIMLALPPYCRPFASLRKRPSLWPYVAACSLAKVRDHRARYNFNLSHLRFFAHSRERYLRVLDECHIAHSVAGREQELAEAEQDLRYPDVILLLRQRMQRRYAAKLSTQLGGAPAALKGKATDATESPSLSGVKVISSTHLNWDLVRLSLPTKTSLEVVGTAVVIRDCETVVTVDDVVLHANEATQHVKKPNASLASLSAAAVPTQRPNDVPAAAEGGATTEQQQPDAVVRPLFQLRKRTTPEEEGKTGDGRVETRVELAELGLRLRLEAVHAVAVPLLDVLANVGLTERVPVAALQASSEAAEGEAARVSQTFICVVPRATLQLNALVLLLDRLAVTATTMVVRGQAPVFPKYGCTLAELSIRGRDGAYLLSPVTAKMQGADDAIFVSQVQISVSNGCWGFLQQIRDRVQDLVRRVPPPLLARLASLAAATTPDAPPPLTYAFLQKCQQTLPLWHDIKRRAQHLVVAGIRLVFEPLELTLSITRVQVSRTAMRRSARAKESSASVGAGGARGGGVATTEPAQSPAAFRNSHGVHVRVNYVGVSVSHTKRLTLSVAMTDGVDVFLGSVHHTHTGVPMPVEPDGAFHPAAWTAATMARVASVSVACSACREKAMPAASATATERRLLDVRGVNVALAGAYSYVVMDGVKALNSGITVSSLQVLVRTDTAAIVSTERPYRASFLQLSCSLAEVSLPRVLAIDFDRLIPMVTAVVGFLVEELIPTVAYQLFFSGFTDAAVCLSSPDAAGCRVSWGSSASAAPPAGPESESEAVYLVLNPTLSPETRRTLAARTRHELASFGVLLPSVLASSPPLVMINNVESLCVFLGCSQWHMGIASHSPPPTLRAEVGVTLTDLRLEVPLGKMDFWADSVKAIAPWPVKVTLSALETAVATSDWHDGRGLVDDGALDGATRELLFASLSGLSFESQTHATALRSPGATAPLRNVNRASSVSAVPSLRDDRNAPADAQDPNGTGSPSGEELSTSFSRGRAFSSTTGSETASCTSSLEEEHESSTLHLRSWGGVVSLAHDIAHYAAVKLLAGKLQRAASVAAASLAVSRSTQRVSGSLSCRTLELPECGHIYVDSRCHANDTSAGAAKRENLDVVVLESCCFVWPTAAAQGSIVVCPDTAVLFKNCVFKRPTPVKDPPASSSFVYIRSADDGATGLFALQDCVEVDSASPSTPAEEDRSTEGSPGAAVSPPLSPRPPRSAGADERKTRKRSVTVVVLSGTFALQLDAVTTVALRQMQLSASAVWKAQTRVARVHCDGVRLTLEERRCTTAVGHDGVAAALPAICCTPICSRMIFGLDVSERKRKDMFALSASLDMGEVYVPLVATALRTPVMLLRALSEEHGSWPAAAEEGGFVPPPLAPLAPGGGLAADAADVSDASSSSSVLPYGAWKVLLSLALTPIRVGVPGSGITLATVTLSNAFLWSRREAASAAAQVEARFALHDMGVWEFSSRSLQSVCPSPCFLALQGQLSPQASCTVQATVSNCDATLTSSQVRLLTTVAAQCAAVTAPRMPQEPRHHHHHHSLVELSSAATAHIVNDSGVCMSVNTGPPVRGDGGGAGRGSGSVPGSKNNSSSRRVGGPPFSEVAKHLAQTKQSSGRKGCNVVIRVGGDSRMMLHLASGSETGALPSAGSGSLIAGVEASALAGTRNETLSVSAVRTAPRPNAFTYGLETCAIAVEADYVELSDGTVLHVLAALCAAPSTPLLSQTLFVRTTFQVRNESSFALRFTSRSTQDSHVVPSDTVGSIPVGLLFRPDVDVAVQHDAAKRTAFVSTAAEADSVGEPWDVSGAEEAVVAAASSLREPLWENGGRVTPMQVLQNALDTAVAPPGFHKEFVSQHDGSKSYLAFEFALDGRVLMMSVRPSQPAIRNNTCFPVDLSVRTVPLADEGSGGGSSSAQAATVVAAEHVAPGEEVCFYHLDPRSPYTFSFSVDVNGECFVTGGDHGSVSVFPARNDASDDSDNVDAVGRTSSFVARHEKQPKRFSFTLVAVQLFRSPGCCTRVWSIGAPAMALLINRSSLDVAVTAAGRATSAGSLGPVGLRAGTYGYVPAGTGLLLRAKGTEPSASFELEKGYAGGLIVCDADEAARGGASSAATSQLTGVAAFFLVRPVKGFPPVASPPQPNAAPFELLPPVLLVNECATQPLWVRNEVCPLARRRGELVPTLPSPVGGSRLAVDSRASARSVLCVEVPPGGQTGQHWLSTSGFTNALSFSCDGGRSYSETVETDLLPGTDWRGVVLCRCQSTTDAGGGDETRLPAFTHQHRVRVVKKDLCDPAAVIIGPPEQLAERIVNFTETHYDAVGGLSVAPFDASRLGTTPATLTLSDATRGSVVALPILGGGAPDGMLANPSPHEDAAQVRVRSSGGNETTTVVVASGRTLLTNGITLLPGQLSSRAAAPGRDGEAVAALLHRSPESSLRSSLVVRVECQLSRQSLRLLDTSSLPLRLSLDLAMVWANYNASAVTLQFSAKGISVDNTTAVESPTMGPCQRRYALEPFSVDIAVRDAQLSPSTLQMQSLRANCTPLTINVSDLLLVQLVRLSDQCAPACVALPPPPSVEECLAAMSSSLGCQRRTSVADRRSTPFRVFVAKATMAEIPVHVSWDRHSAASTGGNNEAQEAAQLLGLAAYIPSLRRASLLLPTLQFTDISTSSPAEFAAMVQQMLFVEVLKQLPHVVSSVGFLPRSTSMVDSITSRVASFFFGGSAGDTDARDDGGAALL